MKKLCFELFVRVFEWMVVLFLDKEKLMGFRRRAVLRLPLGESMKRRALLVPFALALAGCDARHEAPAPVQSGAPPEARPTEEVRNLDFRKIFDEQQKSYERLIDSMYPIVKVTGHPIAKEHELRLHNLCGRYGGKSSWRGGWAPFYCEGRPDCGEDGYCMEGYYFVVYQLTERARW